MLRGLRGIDQRRQTIAIVQSIQSVAKQSHSLLPGSALNRDRLAPTRYAVDVVVDIIAEEMNPVNRPGVVVRCPVGMRCFSRNYQKLVFTEVRTLAVYFDIAVTIDT